jgi:hypothetical protein
MQEDRAGLLWDRTFGETGLRALLSSDDDALRLWAIRRLLEYGEWDEIWRELTLDDVEWALPRIVLRSRQTQSFWREAVAFWRGRAP